MSKSPDQTFDDPDLNSPPSVSPLPSQSGLPIANKSVLPRALPGKAGGRTGRKGVWLSVVLLISFIAGDLAAYYFLNTSLLTGRVIGPRTVLRPDVILHTVKKETLNVTVTEKGTLESADSREIVCRVRAGSKGFATTIKDVIEDGTRVKPGQLLMVLDDSALRDQEESQSIVFQTASAAKVKAEKDYEIQAKKNESAIALAQTTLTLAELELDKLTGYAHDPTLVALTAVAGIPSALAEGGSYRQELDDLSGQISLAQSTVQQNRERAAWADRMVKLSYMSPAQAQAEKSRLDSSLEDLRSKMSKKSLLISHDRKQRLTDLTSKRDNAFRDLEKARLEADATEIQFRIEMQTKTSIYNQEKDKLEDIQKQRRECKITAPDDIEEGSMVVYFKPESSRFGSSSSQGLIEQGAQVKEGQKMLRIPNLSRMQVNTKVHEAMVARIRGDVRVPTRIVELTQVGMLFNTDLFGRIIATRQDTVERVREALREQAKQSETDRNRDIEYEKVADGQRAMIRLDSIPTKQFVGHVKTVAAVASQADMFMSDVKLYQTLVRIDGELGADGKIIPLKQVIAREGELLKPDMTAEVTINVDAAKTPVLTAPIQAIIGGTEMGATREVFVKTASGEYERKPVTLGLYNERMVEVRTGLAEGDEIVVNPKVLMGDSKTKTRDGGDQKGSTKGGDSKDAEMPTKKGKKGGGMPPAAAPGGGSKDGSS
ncbi:MAG: hypothetical protein C0467_02405 [Planctomycetaceae bacterium]|nr:hypothetical protein [Planctomycetaceae bacterium]